MGTDQPVESKRPGRRKSRWTWWRGADRPSCEPRTGQPP